MKTYVVFEGRVPGVYDEWKDCKKQVYKFSGNCYQGYETREEAVAAWRNHSKNKMVVLLLLLLLIIIVFIIYFILA